MQYILFIAPICSTNLPIAIDTDGELAIALQCCADALAFLSNMCNTVK